MGRWRRGKNDLDRYGLEIPDEERCKRISP